MNMKLFLTGATGFVGTNLSSFLSKNNYHISSQRFSQFYFDNNFAESNAIIHLAGKAHDLKKSANSEEYYLANTDFSKLVFDLFLKSDAKIFITLSSVKAVADVVKGELTEETSPNPITHYGKSKLLAEQYILSQEIPEGKRVYILRPCMIHGKGNKGNLNLLYKLITLSVPWPLGAFENNRSFCSIDNLMFIVKELLEREDIPSGIYNIADDEALSTNEVISIIAKSRSRIPIIWNLPKKLINLIAKFGDVLKLPLNTERLIKLTESYVVNNNKIMKALDKPLPISAEEGLFKTFQSFKIIK